MTKKGQKTQEFHVFCPLSFYRSVENDYAL